MTQEQLTEILKDGETGSELDLLSEREIEFFSLLSQGTPSHIMLVEMGIDADDLALLKASIRKKL
ncbi:MAG: hypothetical protein JWM99_2973, partial [Verrucomicrobiales bacterium]|nr:hypothetical protein [Verrucomicrobiales bacterium]